MIDHWTGRHATALQTALRMSQDEMADLLGIAKRTIASWHEKPDVVIRPELQRALDTRIRTGTRSRQAPVRPPTQGRRCR